jgi:ABC-type Zn uptake system ZnuABC Zn-binding protein ZnuA
VPGLPAGGGAGVRGGTGTRLGAAAAALAVLLVLEGCSRRPEARAPGKPVVLAIESFLSDITRQVAGDRLEVQTLIPEGMEPHGYEPTPRDMARLSDAALVVANGAGLEAFLGRLLQGQGGGKGLRITEASAGLPGRSGREGEAVEGQAAGGETDPHFFMDPVLVIRYGENIAAALSALDPAGAAVYRANAAAYAEKLRQLDARIAALVSRIPVAERMLVTNHESLGYFADRYGFRVVGTVIPSVSTDAAPTARQVALLVEKLRGVRARAVFLETGANPQLARQIAAEAGVPVVTELYTHSLSAASGPAPSYIAMMEYDAKTIVDALTGGTR